MSAEVVGPLPTVLFRGGPDGSDNPVTLAYTPPRNTCDPRYAACTEHRVACDCREAEMAENLCEHRDEWRLLGNAAASALVGHQVMPPLAERGRGRLARSDDTPLCLCSGCVIHRATRTLVPHRAVDFATGRVVAVAPLERKEIRWP